MESNLIFLGNNICPSVIPAKAGIQNWPGCRIKSGMTFDMFNCRSNKHGLSLLAYLTTTLCPG